MFLELVPEYRFLGENRLYSKILLTKNLSNCSLLLSPAKIVILFFCKRVVNIKSMDVVREVIRFAMVLL